MTGTRKHVLKDSNDYILKQMCVEISILTRVPAMFISDDEIEEKRFLLENTHTIVCSQQL